MVKLYQSILDDGNYGFGNYAIMELYRLCARTAAEQHLSDEAQTYIRSWRKYHQAYYEMKNRGGEIRYTAPLVQGVMANVDEMPPVKSWEETVRLQPAILRSRINLA